MLEANMGGNNYIGYISTGLRHKDEIFSSQVNLLLLNFIETEPTDITTPRSSWAAAGSL